MTRRFFAGALALMGCMGEVADGPPPDPGSVAGTPGGPAAPGAPAASPAPMGAAPAAQPLPFRCATGARTAAPTRIWLLTERQYTNTVRDLLGGLTATIDNPFQGNATLSAQLVSFSTVNAAMAGVPEPVMQRVFDAADQMAAALAPKLAKDNPCLAAPDAACLGSVFSALGARALRRPLPADELKRYVDLVAGMQAALGADTALQRGLGALFSSPWFLFRTELGDGTKDASGRVRLTPWEVAAALSYTLLEAPPDAGLRAAAAQGALATVDQIRAQVDRLLGAGAVTTTAALQFVAEWFPYGRVRSVSKPQGLYPYYQPDALVDDTNQLAKALLGAGDDLLRNLLTSPKAYARAATAPAYNATGVAATTPQMIDLAGQRSGLITQPSFLAAFSDDKANLPIKRGRWITESLLCGTVPDLPIKNFPPEPDLGPNPTLRETLDAHRRLGAECAGCHRLMDGIGLGLEGYDHTGRARTMEAGRPVVTTGELIGAGAQDGPFDGALALGKRLADSEVTVACFVRQSFRYWLGRAEDAAGADDCTLATALGELQKGRGNLRPMLVSLLASDSFLYRTPSN